MLGQVKQLNCHTRFPQPFRQNNVIVNTVVTDMCIIDQKLVIVSANGVAVFDIGSKVLEYRIPCNLPQIRKELKASAVTSARLGYLFICDTNNQCVHMFNVNADCEYMGVLLKAGEYGLGELERVRLCDRASSLVVAHRVDSKCLISVVTVEHYKLCS